MTAEEIKKFFIENVALKIVLSDKIAGDFNKISIRPVLVQNKQLYQVEKSTKTQVFHENLPYLEAINKLQIENFKQILFEMPQKTYVF